MTPDELAAIEARNTSQINYRAGTRLESNNEDITRLLERVRELEAEAASEERWANEYQAKVVKLEADLQLAKEGLADIEHLVERNVDQLSILTRTKARTILAKLNGGEG